MKECPREFEVAEAVTSGRWPDASGLELRNHVSTCTVCKDIVLVATALYNERESAVQHASIPSAGLVWWRAELQARREAVRRAERPMTLAHSLAAASAAGVALALLGGLLPFAQELLTAFRNLPQLGLLIGGLAMLLIVAPLAVYFVLSDK
ncbi:MAG TPA: hypothetical protein VKY31_09075 [Terriglobia bacterium]|nr:hypothetical protein [Terriglobia bacterium]